MAKNERTKDQIQRDRVSIAEWYCEGKYQSWIATELKVTQQQISYDLKAIRKVWLSRQVAAFDVMVAEEIARIDHLDSTWRDAWERSQKKGEIDMVKTVTGDKPRDEVAKRIEHRDGNPSFLTGVERCIELRVKLLGLNAPERIAISSWRDEATAQGLDPDVLKAGLVDEFVQAMRDDTDNDSQ